MDTSTTTQEMPPPEKEELVYFHSGSGPSYRKVAAKGTTSGSFTSIPTIDISAIHSPDLSTRKALAREIYSACSTTGFFYASNHGIPNSTQSSIFSTIQNFFALPTTTKMSSHAHKNPAMRGYEPLLETRLDPRTSGDIKEAFTIGDCVLEPEQSYTSKTNHPPPEHIKHPQNIWPSGAPEFRRGMYEYYAAIYPLALSLVRIFALAFGLEEDAFDSDFSFPIWGLRALHYPPMPADREEHANGLGAHADFSWITLVLQDEVGGLEVLNREGVWVGAPFKEGTFVVNVGQYLERQTNGKFPATVHRVRNMTGERRYSIPFFLSPNPEAVVDVLPSCLEEGESVPEPTNVGDLYIRRVLPARKKHPTSIKYRDVPESEWKYEMLYAK